MQIVMAQLSERVEHLMDMSSERLEHAGPSPRKNKPATTRTTTNASAATAATGVGGDRANTGGHLARHG
jgi:hypothetical protein